MIKTNTGVKIDFKSAAVEVVQMELKFELCVLVLKFSGMKKICPEIFTRN